MKDVETCFDYLDHLKGEEVEVRTRSGNYKGVLKAWDKHQNLVLEDLEPVYRFSDVERDPEPHGFIRGSTVDVIIPYRKKAEEGEENGVF